MADLFEKDTDTIGLHIKHILQEGELQEESTTEFYSVVQQEGRRKVTRNIKFYNLDIILSVGFRVNSKKGTQFRIWANKVLKEYLINGYSINEKRLKEQSEQLKNLKNTVALLNNVGGNISNLRRHRSIPKCGGKSCQPIVFCRKESFLFRRKQKNCGLSFCLVYGQERHLVYN